MYRDPERPRRPAAECAVEILRETGNPALMGGDTGLVHLIVERAGMEHRSSETQKMLLDAIDRSNRGHLVRGMVRQGKTRTRIFWLPEHAPEWARISTGNPT
jgi:hypothetical protein